MTTATVKPRMILILVALLILLSLAYTAILADDGTEVAGGTILPPAPTGIAVGLESYHPMVRVEATPTP